MGEKELLALMNDVSDVHARWIFANVQKKIENKHEDLSDTAELLWEYLKRISYNKIAVEELRQGVRALYEAKNKLWNLTEAVLLVKCEGIFLPNIYDMLFTVFKQTDSKQRQKYFHQLTRYYYKKLEEAVENKGFNLEDILSESDFEEYIEEFLPCVKLDTLKFLLENFSESKEKAVKNLVEELVEFMLCPNLLREDCYRIIDKLHYEDDFSFSFELKPIEGLFGNLGHYYKLKLFIDCSGNLKELKFFTKSPPTDNEYDEDNFNECIEYLRDVGIIQGLHYNQVFSLPVDINPYRTNDNDKKMEFVVGDRNELYQAALKDEFFSNKVKGFVEDLYNYIK